MQRWLNQHLWHRKYVGFCPPFGSLHHSSSFIIHWNKVFQSWGYPNTKQVTVNHTVRKWFISPSLLWWHQGESLSLGLVFNASITLTNSPFLTNCLGLKFRRRQATSFNWNSMAFYCFNEMYFCFQSAADETGFPFTGVFFKFPFKINVF